MKRLALGILGLALMFPGATTGVVNGITIIGLCAALTALALQYRHEMRQP